MTVPPPHLVRTAATVAALVLALLSRGDVIVLGPLLVLAAWRVPSLVVVPALVVASWRFGSTALGALAGSQAVLGPAGVVGPARAAAGSWCAALAVIIGAAHALERPATGERPLRHGASPKRWERGLAAASVGASAAVVVAGPAPGGALWVRLAGLVGGAVLAALVAGLRATDGPRVRLLDPAAGLAALLSVVLIVPGAPDWAGTVDGTAMLSGLLLALAVAIVTVVGSRSFAAARAHRAA